MKVAILTQPLHNNYGGILQNFALQFVLKELGFDPVTLDVSYAQPHWSFRERFVKFVWRLIKKLCGDTNILFCDVKKQWVFMNHPGVEQVKFIENHIKTLHFENKLDGSFCSKYRMDAFIVGSDQVWRPRFSPNILNYFLDFTHGESVRRVSYAASFGIDQWEGSALETVDVLPLIRQFDAISVREKSGIKLCRNVFGVYSDLVLDPTLLVDKRVYEELLFNMKPSSIPYLAIYVLDCSKAVKKLVNRICREKNLRPLYLGSKDKKGYPSVESWLQGIFCSDYVLTDSFHGTVFSIVGHKPFTTLLNSGRGATRFESLLGELGLMERLVIDDRCAIISTAIDYFAVDKKLADLKEKSICYLKRNLNGRDNP